MEYLFYLSYARANLDPYVERFFLDLSRAIRESAGLPLSSDVGFFDQDDLELGRDWKITVAGALQDSRVMVALYSPAYFQSEYCGKEWEIFQRRWQFYLRNSREVVLGERPTPVIKPVLWIPSRHMPEAAARLQYGLEEPVWSYNERGLKELCSEPDYQSMIFHRKHPTNPDYEAFIPQLADDILGTSRKFALPPLDPLPALSQVRSAFYLPPLHEDQTQPPSTLASSALPDETTPSPVTQGDERCRIFISYRRGDGAGYAGRLYDKLTDHFGIDRVFMDVDTIEPGDDFIQTITDAVKASAVLIALIGKQWVNATDDNGQRRLNNPDDFVALEISTAIKNNIRVIPLLIQGTSIPQSQELPESLSSLANRNAFEISDLRWKHDVSRLIEFLEQRVLIQH